MARVAAIQMTSTPDVAANLRAAGELLAGAATGGADIAALPENFAWMGRDNEDRRTIVEPDGRGPIQEFLAEAAARHRMWIIGGTVPLESGRGNARSAAACVVYDKSGERVSRYDKMHLFDVHLPDKDERYLESANVAPGDSPAVVDTPAGKLGLAVCYDVRFPELFRRLSAAGAEWFSLPSAFTAPTGRAHWETLLRARAIENLCYMVAPAQSGMHVNGRETYGDSMIVDFWGRVLTRLPRGTGVVLADFELGRQSQARQRFPALAHRVM
jgi:deaminated glutathione amidase